MQTYAVMQQLADVGRGRCGYYVFDHTPLQLPTQLPQKSIHTKIFINKTYPNTQTKI